MDRRFAFVLFIEIGYGMSEVFNLCHAVDPTEFQARVADPTAQGGLASTFRTPGWARTCLIKIAYQTT